MRSGPGYASCLCGEGRQAGRQHLQPERDGERNHRGHATFGSERYISIDNFYTAKSSCGVGEEGAFFVNKEQHIQRCIHKTLSQQASSLNWWLI